MKAYRAENASQLLWELSGFEAEGESLIAAARIPLPLTLSEAAAGNMAERCGNPWIAESAARSRAHCRRLLSGGHTVTELLRLPEMDEIRAGSVSVPLWDFFGASPLCYTPGEFADQLQAVAELLKTEPNYQVVLLDPPVDHGGMLCKDGVGGGGVSSVAAQHGLCD